MKKLMLLLGMLAFLACNLASCGAAKKLHNVDESYIDSTQFTNKHNEHSTKSVDTTRKEVNRVTITEIEFYPSTPSTLFSSPPKATSEDNKEYVTIVEPHSPNSMTMQTPQQNNNQGGIKSIKQTVIENGLEQKGESKETNDVNDSTYTSAVINNNTVENEESEPTKDPYRWRYICIIVIAALIAIALVIYGVKRTSILTWLKNIFVKILSI